MIELLIMKKIIFKLLKFLTKTFTGTRIGKIPGIVQVHNFIFESLKPKGIILINCQGNKMYVDAEDIGVVPFLLDKGIFEPFETELLNGLIMQNMTVVNIGANIGYYTLIAANKVGPNGKVYAFEPEPQNYKLLVKNIEENGYKNVVAIQAAVSDKRGTRELFLDRLNLGAHSLAEKNIREKNRFVEIETNSLDNFLEKYSKGFFKADLILIDTEGSEGLILNGASKILENNKLKIVMEFWPYGLANMGTDALGLLKKMENQGFVIKFIDEGNKCVSSLPPEKIIEMCMRLKNGNGSVNLLLEKNE